MSQYTHKPKAPPVVVDGEPITTDSWCTQADLCADLGMFTLDVASNQRSRIMSLHRYTLEAGNDGLRDPWFGSVWCNGPYSSPLPWCERLAAYRAPWACLWKLDPTTEWYRVLKASGATEGQFRKRLRFDMPNQPPVTANFCSVLFWRDWQPSNQLLERLWL